MKNTFLVMFAFMISARSFSADPDIPHKSKRSPITRGGLILEKMDKLINKGAPIIDSVTQKDIVLVLGNTGAGKSTTINYLLGGKAENTGDSRDPIVSYPDPNDERAKVGRNTGRSKTVFPRAYENKDKSIYHLCDTPGFEETRGIEKVVVVSASTKAAIKKARAIKALMVVIDYSSFSSEKAAGLVALSKQLGKLIKNTDNLSSSILFIISKAPDAKLAIFKDKINQLKEAHLKTGKGLVNRLISYIHTEEQKQKAEDDLEISKGVLSVLGLIEKDKYDNVHFIDIFDNFESKKKVEDLLHTRKPVSLSEFKFNDYDTDSVKFEEVLVQNLESKMALIDKRNEIAAAIEEKNIKIVDANKSIKGYNDAISALDECQQIKPEDRAEKEDSLTKQIREKKEQVLKFDGAKIYILSRLPQDNLAKYHNSYLIIDTGKVEELFVSYVNGDGESKKIINSKYSYDLECILSEIRGLRYLYYTINSEHLSMLYNYAAKPEPAKIYSKVRFASELPKKEELNYPLDILIVKNSSDAINFYSVNKDSKYVDITKDIPPYLIRKFKKYGFFKEDTPLNDLLSIEQLMALYNQLGQNYFRGKPLTNISILKRAIKETEEELQITLSDNEVKYWEDSISEERNFFGKLFKWYTKKNFSFNAALPFANHEEDPESDFTNIIFEAEKGVYSSSYQSAPSKDGKASVKVFVKEKDLPTNTALNKILAEEKKKHLENLGLIKESKKTLLKEIDALESALTNFSNEGRISETAKYKGLIDEKNKEIEKLKSEMGVLKTDLIDADQQSKKVLTSLESNFFYIAALGFNNKLAFVKYLLKYNAYKSAVDAEEISEVNSIFALHKALYKNGHHFDISVYKEKMKSAFINDLDRHQVDESLFNIIHHIVKDGLESLLPFYHEQGVSFTACNKQGESPLFLAVRLGNLKALKKFEELQISLPEETMTDGSSLLHYALSFRKRDVFTWLLSKVPKNKVNKSGFTVLQMAIQQKNEEFIKLMFQAGGALDICNDDQYKHYNMLYNAVENNDQAALELILNYADLTSITQALNTPFSRNKYNRLHGDSANIAADDLSESELPLVCALRKGNLKIINQLLNIHPVHEGLDAEGNNMLHIAAQYAENGVLDQLWSYLQTMLNEDESEKRYINQYNKSGYTPFHLAVKARNSIAVTWFLNNNVVDKNKLTKPRDKIIPKQSAMHLAIATHDILIINKLIDAKDMALRATNGAGKTPLEFAKQEKLSSSQGLRLKDKILTHFTAALERNLEAHLGVLVQEYLVTDKEKSFLMAVTMKRILRYLNDDLSDGKRLRKVVLDKSLSQENLGRVSRVAVAELKRCLSTKQKKSILFKNLSSSEFSQIDEILPLCFKPLLLLNFEPEKAVAKNSIGLHILPDEVRDLKKKGFRQALGQSLQYLFYVHLALVKDEVDPKSSNFTSAMSLFSTFSPTIAGYVNQASGDSFGTMKTNLAFSLLNCFFLLVKQYEKQQAIDAAQRIVDAFGNGLMLDQECIDAITEAFYNRYKDQIYKMSMSLSTNKKLRLHERDGVVQFANVIGMRIGKHILQDKNKIIGESNIAFCRSMHCFGKFLEQAAIKVFGEAQNLTADKPMPILQRCMMAIWNESDGLDKNVELDIICGGKNKTWLAGHILTQTGYRLLDDHAQCFIRNGHYDEDIGLCYVTMEEVKKRGKYTAIEAPLSSEEDDL